MFCNCCLRYTVVFSQRLFYEEAENKYLLFWFYYFQLTQYKLLYKHNATDIILLLMQFMNSRGFQEADASKLTNIFLRIKRDVWLKPMTSRGDDFF